MKKGACLLAVISCCFFLISDSSFVHRRVREEFNYWQGLQTEVEKIDFEAVPVRDLTTYFFKDEVFRALNRWMQTGLITPQEISSLLTIAKSLGLDFQTVKEGLNGKEQFRALLDEITTRAVYKLVDLIQKGEERYYRVVDYVSYPLIPYLKQYYKQLISDDSENAAERRTTILTLALRDTASSSSAVSEFLWEVITSENENISSQEKELALAEIGYCGNFDMFVYLLKYIGQSNRLGVSGEVLDTALNTMAKRFLRENNAFENPSQLADMVEKKGSVILRTKDGDFIEVTDFRPILPGLWLLQTSTPPTTVLTTWKRFKASLAVMVDWSLVKSYIPSFKQ